MRKPYQVEWTLRGSWSRSQSITLCGKIDVPAASRRWTAACTSNGESSNCLVKAAYEGRAPFSVTSLRTTAKSWGFSTHCRVLARRIAVDCPGASDGLICYMHTAYDRWRRLSLGTGTAARRSNQSLDRLNSNATITALRYLFRRHQSSPSTEPPQEMLGQSSGRTQVRSAQSTTVAMISVVLPDEEPRPA
jgi:hypothetical protein